MSRLSVTLLGGFAARAADGEPVPIARRKAAALLAYLASSAGREHPRDKIAALLWPEASEGGARHSLRQALTSLRQALPPGAVRMNELTLAVEPEAVNVDVVTFERLVAEGTPAALLQAAALYGGDFLAGLDITEPSFEEWLLTERERLRELAGDSLARLLVLQRKANDLPAALQTALRLVALDPLQEAAHRAVMRLQAAQGRRNAALRQYQFCVDLLQRDLGVEPEAETRELYREILRQRESSRRLEADAADAGERPVFRSAPVSAVDAPAAPTTAMVGREAELASLSRALVEPSRQRVAAILGEAGIGKSRLLAEFHTRALLGGARVLLGRSYETARIVPFGPWIDGLRRGGVLEAPALPGLGAVWLRELARLFPELAEAEHAPAVTSGDPGRLFEAVAQLLERLAHQQPLVVILEDVHWADDMSLRLLAFLARRSSTASPVLVISARDDEPHPAGLLPVVLAELAAERRLDCVVLAPLSRAQTAELAQRLVRGGSDPAIVAILADRLWALSRGHPFTIVEAMTALDHGSAVPLPGPLALPERVREVIARRLESLTDRARSLAAVAAVIGREFDFALLRNTAALGEDETTDGLEELVRWRILRVADDHFDFTHDRIREVVIAQLLPPRRRQLHRQVAEALEARPPDAGQPAWSALGTHCWEAGLWEKAARYCREAGKTAAAQSADHEAAAWFERALAALEHRPVSADTLAQAVDIRLDLRNSLMLIGAYARIVECMSAALNAARALDDSRRLAWVSLFAEQIHWWTVPTARAGTFAEKAAAIAATDGDPSLQVTGTIYAGFGWYSAGDYRQAISCFARALDLLRGKPLDLRHGHHAFAASSARAHLARALAQIGHFADGLHQAQEAIRLAEEVGHVYSLCVGEWTLGVIHRMRGDHAAAIPVLEHAATLERGLGWVRAVLGLVYAASGRVADGIALLEAQRELAESSGANFVKAWLLHDLGRAYLLADRLDDASTAAQQALALARQRGERGYEALALRLHGDIAARCEPLKVEHAGESYRQALALASELGMQPIMAHCHRALGLLYQRANKGGADDHLGRAALLYRTLGMSF